MSIEIQNVIQSSIWQGLVFSFAVIFIFLFRQPISDLIRKIRKIDIDKKILEIHSTPDAQRKKGNSESAERLLNAVGDSVVVSNAEKSITEELIKNSLDVDSEATKVLVRHLAATQILLGFEQIHSLIFGSQILLLKRLNEVVGTGMPMALVEIHIDNFKHQYSEELGKWSYENYLSFLFQRQLVVQTGNTLQISELGREYLFWIVKYGRSENRPY